MTPQERFAQDYQMPIGIVQQLTTLADWAKRANEGECNGDPHADSANRLDKNANAAEWRKDLDRLTKQIADLVSPYGFTTVEYTGLRPTLKRGQNFIEIP